MHKAMVTLRKLAAARQVNEALNARNGPDDGTILALPLQSEVIVWRENKGWKGPYRIVAMEGHNVTVEMINGPVTFRSTHVRPYQRQDSIVTPKPPKETTITPPNQHDPPQPNIQSEQPRRGRPQGSRNKPKAIHPSIPLPIYLSKKEESDRILSLKLRAEGIITTPGLPFETSDKKEIDQLSERGVFEFVKYDPDGVHKIIRLFKSRIVREVKGKTDNPYEKSRLVIAGHSDVDKTQILTQSPTIQRVSQRLPIAIAACLHLSTALELRDITQAYPQSQTVLQRYILAQLPSELKNKYPPGTVLHVIKPLYGVAESGVHWFTTYQKHHIENLHMVSSTYDPCLMVVNKDATNHGFGMVGMQTDDTLIVASPDFSAKEQKEIEKAKFDTKEKQVLSSKSSLNFNGCIVTMKDDKAGYIGMHQKGQGAKLKAVIGKADNRAQQFLEQRARGAYIASICQPEAAYDLSVAVQAQQPTVDDIVKLNTRLQWQIDNPQRGLNFVPVDLSKAKLMVFTDGSFANNRDLSSQIGYVIMLVNENVHKDSFDIRGNLLHYSSTKCKRVTRSVLASEIYGMVSGFDLGLALVTTLKLVPRELQLKPIPPVICTDSFCLYECLTKLGTTNEKRLMIDVMALRQSYERREIEEIRWINGLDNPADAMTKSSPNQALMRFIDKNTLSIRMDGSVERPSYSDKHMS